MSTIPKTYRAGVAQPREGADNFSDVRALVQLVARGGCGIERMRLVRWDKLRTVFGERWSASARSVAGVLRGEIEARVGRRGRCVRYDGCSFLVIYPDVEDLRQHDLDDAFVASVGAKLLGVLDSPDLIEVLQPVSVGDRELAFSAVNSGGGGGCPDPGGLQELPTAATTPARTLILGDATFRYFPLWDVGTDEVFCYLCEAFWDAGDDGVWSEDALAAQFGDPKRVFALDMETVEKATAALDRGLNQYRLAKFLIPVHFQTLATQQTAESYCRFCNEKMWSVREFALFELVKPPADPTAGQLAALIGRIAPFGAGVMLRLGRDFARFDQIPSDRLLSVGVDIRGDQRPAPAIVADVRTLAIETGKRGHRSHVHGLHGASTAVIAACAGIDFVGSGGIAADLDDWQQDESSAKPTAMLKLLMLKAKALRETG